MSLEYDFKKIYVRECCSLLEIDVPDELILCVTSRKIVWFGGFDVLCAGEEMAKLSIKRRCVQ